MKNKISKILLAFIIMFTMTKTVYGETVGMLFTYYKTSDSNTSDSGNYRLQKNINGKTSELDRILLLNGENRTLGYCLDVGVNLTPGNSISPLGQTLQQYVNNGINNTSLASQVAEKINAYIYVANQKYAGYDMTAESSKEKGEYYAAAQMLIWEELYNAGYTEGIYSSDAYLTLRGNGQQVDVNNEKNEIVATVNDHYKQPSFCSNSEKLELAVGETATYTDNNNVLDEFNLECSEGLECKIEGNKLMVTAVENTGTQKVTLKKDAAGTNTTIYKEGSDQAVIVGDGRLECVTCELGLNSYENVQTSGAKIVLIVTVGLMFGLIAYLIYYRNMIAKEQ